MAARFTLEDNPHYDTVVVPYHGDTVLYETKDDFFGISETCQWCANLPKIGKHGKPTGMYA